MMSMNDLYICMLPFKKTLSYVKEKDAQQGSKWTVQFDPARADQFLYRAGPIQRFLFFSFHFLPSFMPVTNDRNYQKCFIVENLRGFQVRVK